MIEEILNEDMARAQQAAYRQREMDELFRRLVVAAERIADALEDRDRNLKIF